MGNKQIVLSGKEFIKFLEKQGFVIVKTRGSHFRMRHSDGRVTTIHVHKNDDLPKGLMRKIIREDLKLEIKEFDDLLAKNK